MVGWKYESAFVEIRYISMTTKKKILIGVVIALVATAVIRVLATVGLIGLMLFGSFTSKPEVYEEIENYAEYMSFSYENADTLWNKWGMDESIWPRMIKDVSAVADYKMVYYDPWDAQYLGYLVMEYSAEEYAAEAARLKEYPSTDYVGYYSVVEEHTYELLAVNADEYHGFVYALTDGHNRIIYAEEIFCNYYMDLDYGKYIPKEYLLDGFDATKDNPYRKKKMNEQASCVKSAPAVAAHIRSFFAAHGFDKGQAECYYASIHLHSSFEEYETCLMRPRLK